MKKIKHMLLVMVLAAFMVQPAVADILNDDDMAFAFGGSSAASNFGDMALLSHQEMMETEGEWFPQYVGMIAAGGIAGSAAYVWSTPNWTAGGAGLAFGAGATAAVWAAMPIPLPARAGMGAFGASAWYYFDDEWFAEHF